MIVWKRIALLATAVLFLAGCQATGTIQIEANGEDFVREGFTSKDGWDIQFFNLFVNVADLNVYQTDPPYDPSSGVAPAGDETANFVGNASIDLAEGDADADPISFAQLGDVPVGQYNAISWKMVNAEEGLINGFTLQLVGSAQKDGQLINFTINVENEYEYWCGEYVGDVRKGFLESGETTNLEMTFHFDHVFGDADTPADEAINTGALGFDPLAAVAENGQINANMAALSQMLTADQYATLEKTLQTLGHVGEGHCYEASGGYTGDK